MILTKKSWKAMRTNFWQVSGKIRWLELYSIRVLDDIALSGLGEGLYDEYESIEVLD